MVSVDLFCEWSCLCEKDMNIVQSNLDFLKENRVFSIVKYDVVPRRDGFYDVIIDERMIDFDVAVRLMSVFMKWKLMLNMEDYESPCESEGMVSVSFASFDCNICFYDQFNFKI